MPRAVLDSTVLVSAFLTNTGISSELLRLAKGGAYQLCLSDHILAETRQVLIEYDRIRRRYHYADRHVIHFTQGLRAVARLVANPSTIRAVSRDADDDHVVACALLAKARYLVTRDKDLLSLSKHKGITMLSPEQFLHILKGRTEKV